MRLTFAIGILLAALAFADESVEKIENSPYQGGKVIETLALEAPGSAQVALESLLEVRGAEGEYKRETFELSELSRILELGYGFNTSGRRTVDSIDGTYAILLYLITRDGAYVYIPARKELGKIVDDDIKPRLSSSAQRKNKNVYISGANIVIAGSPTMAGVKNRREGRKYMFIEAGKISQNIELAANSIGISVDSEPDLDNTKMRSLLKMPGGFEAVMMFSLGRLKEPLPATPAASPVPAAVVPAVSPAVQEKAQEKKQYKALIAVPERGASNVFISLLKSALESDGHTVVLAAETQVVKDYENRELSVDILLGSVNVNDYDMYIFPDNGSTRVFRDQRYVEDLISIAYSRGKVIGAGGMSAALLAKAGILSGGVKVTGNSSALRTVREYGGEMMAEAGVIRSGRVVTTSGNYHMQGLSSGATEFAAELIKAAEK